MGGTSASYLKASFNAGELSPLFGGRVDHVKYAHGLKRSQNAIPVVHGAVTRRPGTVLAKDNGAGVDDSSACPVLVPHDVSGDEAWIYVIGKKSERVKVFRNRAEVPVWSLSYPFYEDARRADGTSKISRAQKGRDLYMADDGSSPAIVLTNNESVVIQFNLFNDTGRPHGVLSDSNPTPYVQNYDTPPFQAYEPEKNVIIETAGSAEIGSLPILNELIAPTGTFAGALGRRIVFNPDDFEMKDDAGNFTFKEWAAGLVVDHGQIVRHQGRWYQVLVTVSPYKAALNTEPLHEYGAIYSPKTDVGYKAQMGYIGNGHFSCQIKSNPSAVPGRPGFESVSVYWDMTNAPRFKTSRWAWAAVATGENPEPGAAYPDNLALWRSRLVLSCGGKLFFSVAGKFRSFRQYDGSGHITADQCVSVEIPSRQLVSTEWMVSQDSLIIGSKVGAFEVREASDAVFGPGNVRIDQVTTFGSHNVEAVTVDNHILYIGKGGKRLHALGRTSEGWKSIDLSAIADHIGASGFTEMDWQNEPWKVLWLTTGAGDLVGLTWNADQDVFGWHPHRTIDGDKIRGIACIPSPSGLIDDLWLSVLRYSSDDDAGVPQYRRTIEYLADAHQDGGDLREARYSDSLIHFDGSVIGDNYGLNLMGGALWDESELLTLESVALLFGVAGAAFTADMVGDVVRLVESAPGPIPGPKDSGEYIDLLVESFASATEIAVRPLRAVPERFRATPAQCWQIRRTAFAVAHLDGRTVDVLADGCAHPQVQVVDGVATLQEHACKVTIGIPAWELLETMRIELGAETSTTIGKIKRISHTTLRFLESVGCWIGNGIASREFTFRKPSDRMNAPVPAVTGDDRRDFVAGNGPDGTIVIENRQPLPMTIVSIVADLISDT